MSFLMNFTFYLFSVLQFFIYFISCFLKKKKNFMFLIGASGIPHLKTDTEVGALQIGVEGPPFFLDNLLIEVKDLFFFFGDFYILFIISALLIFGSFNNFRKYYYVTSLTTIKIFVISLFFLSLIYIQYLPIFLDTGLDFKLVAFNQLLIFDLNTLAFRISVLFILFAVSIILWNYTAKYFIMPFEYLLIVLCGIFGMFWFISAGNLVLLFVGLEAQALSFYILASIKKNSSASAEAGLKYFILGAFSSAFVLLSLFYFYLHFGTFSFYDLRLFSVSFIESFLSVYRLNIQSVNIIPFLIEDIDGVEFIDLLTRYSDVGFNYFDPCFLPFSKNDLFVSLREVGVREYLHIYYWSFQFAMIFLLTSLFFKISAAPFHIWSPDVYEGAPLPTTQIFSTLAKFVIFILLIRLALNFHMLNQDFVLINKFIRFVIFMSVIIGTFNALVEQRIKKFIAYSSITHTGYMLYGISSGTFSGIDSSISYLIAYLFLNCILWGLLLTLKENKKLVVYLVEFSDLFAKNKFLTFIFALIVSCMAGFPPFIFFYLKLKIFLSNGNDFILFFLLVCFTTLSAYYYLRIIKIIFFEQQLYSNVNNRVEVSNSLAFLLSFGAIFLIVFSLAPSIVDTVSKIFVISFYI